MRNKHLLQQECAGLQGPSVRNFFFEGLYFSKTLYEKFQIEYEVMKAEAFNRVLSDKISYNSSVPDSRDPL